MILVTAKTACRLRLINRFAFWLSAGVVALMLLALGGLVLPRTFLRPFVQWGPIAFFAFLVTSALPPSDRLITTAIQSAAYWCAGMVVTVLTQIFRSPGSSTDAIAIV